MFRNRILILVICLLSISFSTSYAHKSSLHDDSIRKYDPPPTEEVPPPPPITAVGSATFTSDFMWRGRSLSNGAPAAQIFFGLYSRPGFYINTEASNVNFVVGPEETKLLILPSAGYKRKLFGLGFDFGVSAYIYPTAIPLNWHEGYFKVNYSFLIAGVIYSNNFLKTKSHFAHVFGGFLFKLPERVFGHNFVTRDVSLKIIVSSNFFSDTLTGANGNNFELKITKELSKHYALSFKYSNSDANHVIVPLSGSRFVAAIRATV